MQGLFDHSVFPIDSRSIKQTPLLLNSKAGESHIQPEMKSIHSG